jgi:acetylornithine deacetylase/succinyl-diaminopimelate desuccinylase-like protein
MMPVIKETQKMETSRELAALLTQLVQIPAPSHHEQARGAFIEEYLNKMGWQAWIDAAGNVVCPMEAGAGGYTVVMAHIDTVFPDETITAVCDGDILRAPGVGDDTANVVILLEALRQIRARGLKPRRNLLFVFNVCEEGLGDLKGVKQIMADYAGRVDAVVSLDSRLGSMIDGAVGSKRYEVRVTTRGGHSYAAFGNENAIAAAARIVGRIYQGLPQEAVAGSYTTYNVGAIRGGTSINTIAQECTLMAEVRSDSAQALTYADAWLRAAFEAEIRAGAPEKAVSVCYTLVGDRPSAGNVPPEAQRALVDRAREAIFRQTGVRPEGHSASTDCNIPLSLGVPAVCFGGYEGAGAHTREEWVRLSSLPRGVALVMDFLSGDLTQE